jgi:hypothetical protein
MFSAGVRVEKDCGGGQTAYANVNASDSSIISSLVMVPTSWTSDQIDLWYRTNFLSDFVLIEKGSIPLKMQVGNGGFSDKIIELKARYYWRRIDNTQCYTSPVNCTRFVSQWVSFLVEWGTAPSDFLLRSSGNRPVGPREADVELAEKGVTGLYIHRH